MTLEEKIGIQKKILDALTPIIAELRENGVLSAHLHIDDMTGDVDVQTWTKDDRANVVKSRPDEDIRFIASELTRMSGTLFPLPATDGVVIDDATRNSLSTLFAVFGGLLMAMMANDFEGKTKLISVLMHAAGVRINRGQEQHSHPM